MMSTKSSLLLVAFASGIPLLSAFTCNWRGGDYSAFTFRIDLPGFCCNSGNCLNGYVDNSFNCNNDFYEDCFNCNSNSGVCCRYPYSKQYERESTTTCCQRAGDEVFNPITNTNLILTDGICDAAVRWRVLGAAICVCAFD